MIASCNGTPSRSTATVPDHCDVTATAATSSGAIGARSMSLRLAAVAPAHHASGDCSTPPSGKTPRPTAVKSPSTNSPSNVNSATFGPDVPRSIVRTCSATNGSGSLPMGRLHAPLPSGRFAVVSLLHAALQTVPEEATLRTGVGVVVVGDIAHVVVDVVLEREVLRDHHRELLVHVRQLLARRRDAVAAPHDHRDRADLASG